jgi:hypothetical protein
MSLSHGNKGGLRSAANQSAYDEGSEPSGFDILSSMAMTGFTLKPSNMMAATTNSNFLKQQSTLVNMPT